MLRVVFFIFTIVFASPNLWAANVTVQEAQSLVEGYNKIHRNSSAASYHKYLLLTRHMGPLQFKDIDLSKMTQASDFNKTIELNSASIKRLAKWQKSFTVRGLQGSDRDTMRKAQAIVKQLTDFAKTINAHQAHQLVKQYQSDNYSVRKTFKNRLYHFPQEMIRFASAMVIIRMSTCFGGGLMNEVLTWNGPSSLGSSDQDPACVAEVIEMFKSPLFYAGFMAFVVGAGAENAIMLKLLKKIDPAQGRVTKTIIKSYLPQLSLAVGFAADHMVQTLFSDENIKACAGTKIYKLLGVPTKNDDNKGNGQSLARNIEQAVIATDSNGDTIHDGQGAITATTGDSRCAAAYRTITSSQFALEEVGTGLVGLVTTAVALGKLGNMVRKIRSVSYAISLFGGPTSLVVGVGHMVVFLGLFELIDPYIKTVYHKSVLASDVDKKTQNFVNSYWTLDQFKLSNKTNCSQHYSGSKENGKEPLCTRLPIISQAESLSDIGKTWRSKVIMKEAYFTHSKWKKNLNSFFNNYFMSLQHMQLLTRAREVFIHGKSEYEIAFTQSVKKNIGNILKRSYPEMANTDAILAEIIEDFYLAQSGYQSRFKDLGVDDPRKQVFNAVALLAERESILEINKKGDLFYGVGGEANVPSKQEIEALIEDIKTVLKTEKPEIKISGPMENLMNNSLVSHHLQVAEVPYKIATLPYQYQSIIHHLESDSQRQNAIGLMLFKEWAPSMQGSLPVRYGRSSNKKESRYNRFGFTKANYQLTMNVLERLEHYTPDFRNEYIFISQTRNPLGQQKRSHEDSQFNTNSHGFSTPQLSDYVLTELICGDSPNMADWLGDRSGFGLHFNFPHMMNRDVCLEMAYPIHYPGENSPTPLRSVYATSYGLKVGLPNTFIEAPQDIDYPLLFDKEELASQWWNNSIRPDSIKRLKKAQQTYQRLMHEQFSPLVQATEISEKSLFDKAISGITHFFGGQSNEQCQTQRCLSVRSLSLSLQNELYHYRQALYRVLPKDEKTIVEKTLIDLSQCIVKLMNSIPQKKYRVLKSQCDPVKEKVEYQLNLRNGKFADYNSEHRLDTINENQMLEVDIQDSIVRFIGSKVEALYDEIESYDNLINHSFQFELDEGENP